MVSGLALGTPRLASVSMCYGAVGNGRPSGEVRLPFKGNNFLA